MDFKVGLALFTSLLPAVLGSQAQTPFISAWEFHGGPGETWGCDIETTLGPRLSDNATLILPDAAEFAPLEIRASSPRIKPGFAAIVEVVVERDIQETIWFANRCNISFLAVAGSHGFTSAISKANGGIQINMRKMQSIALGYDETTAHVGGGVLQKHLVETLYGMGKQAVTGLCECTSVAGPLLGGGHSILQGYYGFAADNLVSARVVLADGEAVTASASANSDLFWALRGAGHQFGVVTSMEVNAHDLPVQTWTVITFIYTQDKLEAFLDALNELDNHGDHAPELIMTGAITRIPDVDPAQPVIAYSISYLGTAAEAEAYVDRFRQAGPLSVTYASDIAYKDYYTATNNGVKSSACRKDLNLLGYSVSLPAYDKTAMREAFTLFAALTADERFSTSVWLPENYGMRGVRAQEYEASAIPTAERDMAILTSPIIWWQGDGVEEREMADECGRRIREVLAAGNGQTAEEVHTYVNYAMGNENVEQVYGDAARVEKLRALKRRFDPENRFRFYQPIV